MAKLDCKVCHGSGTTTKNAEDGYLDCTQCDSAEIRAKFENWLRIQRPGGQLTIINSARDWAIFRHGYEMAMAEQRGEEE